MTNTMEKKTAEILGGLISDTMTPRLVEFLAEIPIRDAILRTAFDMPEHREQMAWVLAQVVSTFELTEYERATVATVCAGINWLDGKKAETEMMLDLALNADTSYSLARLLNVSLTHGIPPTVWQDSIGAVSLDECYAGAK